MGKTTTPKMPRGLGVALSAEQAQALRIPVTPPASSSSGHLMLTHQQVKALGVTLTHEQAQAPGLLSPLRPKHWGFLSPLSKLKLRASRSPLSRPRHWGSHFPLNKLKHQGSPSPLQQAQALGIIFTPEQAQTPGITPDPSAGPGTEFLSPLSQIRK